MMRLGGTGLAITDDNGTVCMNGDNGSMKQLRNNAQRPDGYTEDFTPNVEQMSSDTRRTRISD